MTDCNRKAKSEENGEYEAIKGNDGPERGTSDCGKGRTRESGDPVELGAPTGHDEATATAPLEGWGPKVKTSVPRRDAVNRLGRLEALYAYNLFTPFYATACKLLLRGRERSSMVTVHLQMLEFRACAEDKRESGWPVLRNMYVCKYPDVSVRVDVLRAGIIQINLFSVAVNSRTCAVYLQASTRERDVPGVTPRCNGT